MFDQLFDSYRKASESWMQMQQDLFRQMTQQWPPMQMPAAPSSATANAAADWNRNFQRRWVELAIEILNKQRESMDWIYRSGTQIIEQTFLASEARSPEDYRRMVEDLWRKLFESFKTQSEAQLRDFQKWTDKSLEIVQTSQA